MYSFQLRFMLLHNHINPLGNHFFISLNRQSSKMFYQNVSGIVGKGPSSSRGSSVEI